MLRSGAAPRGRSTSSRDCVHGRSRRARARPRPDLPRPSRCSPDSLADIRQGLQQQLEAIDTRIESVRRELKEAQAVHAELRLDLDYVEARLAGQPADALLEQRKASAKAGSKK